MQRKEMNGDETAATGELEKYVDTLNNHGQPLPGELRNFYEPWLGYDLGNVKVHTDNIAAKSADSINALAYTSGNNIVFNSGQYSPGTDNGKRLLGHELTHVIQQNSQINTKRIQRAYKLDELTKGGVPLQTNPVSSNPDVSFYQGSAANTTNRKALVIAGIHGSEPSARALGHEIKSQLDAKTAQTDFHTILVPQVNPSPTTEREAGSKAASTYVKDLNRQFGAGYTSKNPLANKITQVVTEFDPERVMSIHAISDPKLGGVFLDPVNSGTYPATKTAKDNERAFTSDPRNLEAMLLAESMIAKIGTTSSTPGNVPTAARPPSHYPGTGTGSSPFSLIYPKQDDISTKGPTSLGVWVSTLGKPIYTVEIPGYDAPASVWKSFLPAIWEFLKIPAAPAPATGPASPSIFPDASKVIEDALNILERVAQIPDPLPKEARPAKLKADCLTFDTRADLDSRKTHWTGIIAALPIADVVKWAIGLGIPKKAKAAASESKKQRDCMLAALAISAATKGSPIESKDTPGASSGVRNFKDQNRIWTNKFEFKKDIDPFDRISDHARTICGGLLFTPENKWDPKEERHRRCWGVAPLKGGTVPPFPAGTRSLTDDEKQMEILQASSAPGISRHHWGTDFDIFSVEPQEWLIAGPGANLLDEYRWLRGNASMYGFIQSFTSLSAANVPGYMEERWHWSYWPVSQALLEFVRANQANVETALNDKWGTEPQFSFIKSHWKEYMFNVNETPAP